TTVKSSPTGDWRTCGVAQGPVMYIATRPSTKSWFGLLGGFIVVLGAPAALVPSRHKVSAFTASGLLRYAVLPSSLSSLPPNCSVRGWKSCTSQRWLWYGK